MSPNEVTEDRIRALLARKDEVGMRAIGRALMRLRERQTWDERSTETTKHRNGRGFRPCHAQKGTSMGAQFACTGSLSPKQVAYWQRVSPRTGKSRIELYTGQLLKIVKGE